MMCTRSSRGSTCILLPSRPSWSRTHSMCFGGWSRRPLSSSSRSSPLAKMPSTNTRNVLCGSASVFFARPSTAQREKAASARSLWFGKGLFLPAVCALVHLHFSADLSRRSQRPPAQRPHSLLILLQLLYPPPSISPVSMTLPTIHALKFRTMRLLYPIPPKLRPSAPFPTFPPLRMALRHPHGPSPMSPILVSKPLVHP